MFRGSQDCQCPRLWGVVTVINSPVAFLGLAICFMLGLPPPPSTCVPFFELQFPSIHPNQGFEILQGREPSPHPGGGGANMASLLLSTPAFLKSGHEVQMTSLSPWDRFLVEHT